MKTSGKCNVLMKVVQQIVEHEGEEQTAYIVSTFGLPKLIFLKSDSNQFVGRLWRPSENQSSIRMGDKMVLVSNKEWIVDDTKDKISKMTSSYEEALQQVA